MAIGIGLIMCQRQELRQELRLALRMEQLLAQRLVVQLGLLSESNKEALYEIFQLERYQDLIKSGTFHSPAEWQKFLKQESSQEANKPAFSKHGSLSPEKRNQVRIPELAKALLNLAENCPEGIIIEETPLDWKAWQLLVIMLSMTLGHANAKPSEIWGHYNEKISEHLAINDTAYHNSFWSLLAAHKDGAGTDIKAAIELIELLLPKLPIAAVTSLIIYLTKETQNAAHDFAALKSQLESLIDCLDEPDKFRLAITVILQNIHYQAGSQMTYHFTQADWEKCFQPAQMELIKSLANLPASFGFIILAGFRFGPEQATDILQRLEQLTADKHFQKSRDDKRLMWRCLNIFRYASQPENSLRHFIGLANTCKELLRGLQAIEQLSLRSRRNLIYPDDATSMDNLISHVENSTRATYKKVLNLSDEELNLLTQNNIWQLVNRNGLLEMCFTYASLCRANDYQRGAELASETLKQAMAKHFGHWRYSHEKSAKQIGFLTDNKPWQEAHKRTMIIGLTDAFQQRLAAIKRLVEQLAQEWQNVVGYSIQEEKVDAEYQAIMEKLRNPKLKPEDKKALGIKAGELKKEYTLVHTLKDLLKVEAESINLIKGLNYHLRLLADRINKDEARMLVKSIIELINQTDTSQISHLTFEDSDKPYELMRVGTLPVQTCQRWNEWTSHNCCLPAYVVDANKRVLWVRNNHFNIIARCILRLLPYEYGKTDKETVPLLILERPYCKAWSKEIGIGILQWIVEKAGKISKENDTPVMVAVKDNELVALLKQALPKSKIKTRILHLQLPPSLNEYEYSDSMGGDLKSGAQIVDKEFHTFFVANDTDQE